MRARPPVLPTLLGLLGALLLCGATCGAPPASGPAAIDWTAPSLERLTAHEREQVSAAAEALACPCGGPRTLDQCAARPQCPRGERRVRIAAALARLGASATEIIGELHAYETALTSPAAIALGEAGCKGEESAPVTLVAFSDFECPACANLPLLVDSLLERRPGQARFCFKHFPLSSHARAREAAQAAEFARRRGRFWQMHDSLFERQHELSREDLEARVRALGLDAAEFGRAVDAGWLLAAVLASREEGRRLGVGGTPTLFINGCRLTLPPSPEILELAIEDEFERRQGARP